MPEFYPEIRELKNNLREEYRAKRRALSAQERARRDEAIARCLLGSISYRSAKTVLLYAATEEEIATDAVAGRALADGKTVAYPRCIVADKKMVFHIVTDLQQLQTGSYGLSEPDANAPVYDFEALASRDLAIAVIPGVVFDRDGYRVGYGKGYYDRFLRAFSGVKIGLFYAEGILQLVPRGRFDLNVDMIVTEKGVLAVGR